MQLRKKLYFFMNNEHFKFFLKCKFIVRKFFFKIKFHKKKYEILLINFNRWQI